MVNYENCYRPARLIRIKQMAMDAEIEAAHQRKLWEPGGLLFDKDDPICQEIINEQDLQKD